MDLPALNFGIALNGIKELGFSSRENTCGIRIMVHDAFEQVGRALFKGGKRYVLYKMWTQVIRGK